MPVIAAFFGIVIRMFYREHRPPHFHAEHGGDRATFTFDGEVLSGGIRSSRARRLTLNPGVDGAARARACGKLGAHDGR